jgi:stage III sporulation protein AF
VKKVDVIFQLVRRLVLVAIFAGFSELLLPSGKFRGIIRFAVGLVVIALMLQPLAQIRGLSFDLEELLGAGENRDGTLQGSEWVPSQSQDLVEEELAQQVAAYLADKYPDCQLAVKLDVVFDQHGFLSEFRGMEVDIYTASPVIKPIMPVTIGGETKKPEASSPPGLAEELARYLGIESSKITLRVHDDGGSAHE